LRASAQQLRAKSRRFAAVALCTRLRAQWRGNPYPSLRSNVSPHRVDNVTPVNDHLPLLFLSGEPKGCGMNTSAKARIVSGDPPLNDNLSS